MNFKFMNLKKYFESSSFLNVIMVTRLIFGSYYRITSSKIVSIFIKFYCICITMYISSICSLSFDIFSPYMICMLKFNVNAIINIFTGQEYFFKYCQYIKTADAIAGVKNASLITKIVVIITAFVFICKAFFSVFYGLTFSAFNSITSFNNWFSILFITVSIDIHFLTVVIVFAILHNRMKILRRSLVQTSVPVNIIGKNEIASKIEKVRNSVRYYNNLLNNLDQINHQVQYSLFISLVSTFPQMIMLLYVTLNFYVSGTGSDIRTVGLLEMLQIFVLVSSPAVIAEMTITEVENIKRTLAKQLRRCSNQSLRFELEIALDYVTHRPFRFVIWRSIPLDINLPLGIITLTITYVIVIVQFIHFNSNFTI